MLNFYFIIDSYITITFARLFMKKAQRVIAVIGLIIIALLYILFFVLAAMGSSISQNMLISAFAATVVVPVLMYMLQLIAKNKSYLYEDKTSDQKDDSSSKQ